MRQIYYFSTLYFSTVGWPRSHHLFCETASNRSGSVRRENQEQRNEGDFTGGRSQGNISLLFPLKTTRAVVPRATSMQNRLIQRFHNMTPPRPNLLPCDLETSSVTQYFPGGTSPSHPPHTATCVKDSAERMWQEFSFFLHHQLQDWETLQWLGIVFSIPQQVIPLF